MSDPYRNPTRECDLVMKGGITSGLVYPQALLELAQEYRFRSIGGTSAGAMAASLAAAAEYGREPSDPKGKGGFEKLRDLDEWLSTGRNLLSLFQPSRSTAALYRVLLALNEEASRSAGRLSKVRPHAGRIWAGRLRRLLVLRKDAVSFWAGGISGGALGLALAACVLRSVFPHSGSSLALAASLAIVISGFSLGLVGAILGSGLHLFRIATGHLPRNHFGLCTGRKDSESPSSPDVLTDWLSARINDLAGLDPNGPPLTFGDLQRKGLSFREGGTGGGEQSIDLRMIATDLSHNQPYVLPFEQQLFLFQEEEMRRFFPANIVERMTHAKRSERVSLERLPGVHFVPDAADLPIVFAARLSMSFPALLSAVPLYTIRQSAFEIRRVGERVVLEHPDEDLQENLFSDGGIASNFPIHFFDRWLPGRPTFGINLTQMPEESFEAELPVTTQRGVTSRKILRAECFSRVSSESPGEDPEFVRSVYLPKANAPRRPEWVSIKSLAEFFGAVWTTAQNHRDRTQAMLPSYRDRIVNIRFSRGEGGLNLAMGSDRIESIRRKGRAAGKMLRNFTFDEHRWVRFLVLLDELEAELFKLRERFATPLPYEDLLIDGVARGHPYPRSVAWRQEALARMEFLLHMVGQWEDRQVTWSASHPGWGDARFFEKDGPKPEGSLRVTPKV